MIETNEDAIRVANVALNSDKEAVLSSAADRLALYLAGSGGLNNTPVFELLLQVEEKLLSFQNATE